MCEPADIHLTLTLPGPYLTYLPEPIEPGCVVVSLALVRKKEKEERAGKARRADGTRCSRSGHLRRASCRYGLIRLGGNVVQCSLHDVLCRGLAVCGTPFLRAHPGRCRRQRRLCHHLWTCKLGGGGAWLTIWHVVRERAACTKGCNIKLTARHYDRSVAPRFSSRRF